MVIPTANITALAQGKPSSHKLPTMDSDQETQVGKMPLKLLEI